MGYFSFHLTYQAELNPLALCHVAPEVQSATACQINTNANPKGRQQIRIKHNKKSWRRPPYIFFVTRRRFALDFKMLGWTSAFISVQLFQASFEKFFFPQLGQRSPCWHFSSEGAKSGITTSSKDRRRRFPISSDTRHHQQLLFLVELNVALCNLSLCFALEGNSRKSERIVKWRGKLFRWLAFRLLDTQGPITFLAVNLAKVQGFVRSKPRHPQAKESSSIFDAPLLWK